MLIDFADDALLLVQRPSVATDARGMQTGGPAVDVFSFNGRISRISGKQQEMWKTLGIQADAEMFCNIGGTPTPGEPRFLLNGDSIIFNDGVEGSVTYRVVGRSRRVAKGSLPNFWAYPLQLVSLA